MILGIIHAGPPLPKSPLVLLSAAKTVGLKLA